MVFELVVQLIYHPSELFIFNRIEMFVSGLPDVAAAPESLRPKFDLGDEPQTEIRSSYGIRLFVSIVSISGYSPSR
jgi:hypothetical protein